MAHNYSRQTNLQTFAVHAVTDSLPKTLTCTFACKSCGYAAKQAHICFFDLWLIYILMDVYCRNWQSCFVQYRLSLFIFDSDYPVNTTMLTFHFHLISESQHAPDWSGGTCDACFCFLYFGVASALFLLRMLLLSAFASDPRSFSCSKTVYKFIDCVLWIASYFILKSLS